MKVVLVNKFLYSKGGDAITTLNTGKLLCAKGHEVIFWGMKHPFNPKYPFEDYFVSNVDFNKPTSLSQQFKTSFNILYSLEAKRKIEEFIKAERPDIVHLNNFAHQISPSILDIFRKYKISTVMTIHDYKLVCSSWYMLAKGKPCEKCEGGKYYWCFLNKCTKNSYLKSLINVVEMYLHHKILHIYDKIDVFISPSIFLKEKLKEMGFKKEIIYLPNFINTKEYEPEYNSNDKTICYFGRLSKEKGVFTLLDAMKGSNAKLKIIGEGPLKKRLRLKVKSEKLDNIDFLGYKTGDELKNEIKNSVAVVLPSECYENNPRAVLEAFASGKPVIGARIGGIPELVKDNETGLTFQPRNPENLREKILMLIDNPNKVAQMGKNARKFVEENFNPEKYYKKLIKIYQSADR